MKTKVTVQSKEYNSKRFGKLTAGDIMQIQHQPQSFEIVEFAGVSGVTLLFAVLEDEQYGEFITGYSISEFEEFQAVNRINKETNLTPDQMKVGAMYMAVSNMGMESNFGHRAEKPYTPEQIKEAFEQTANDFYGETGSETVMDNEMQSWLIQIMLGNKYCVDVIFKDIQFGSKKIK